MFRIGNLVGYWTNPATDMLTGFSLQEVKITEEETQETYDGAIFSIGLFIARIDWFFNMTKVEDEII